MKTILWKELREHGRWAPLGAVPIILILLLKWWSPTLVFDGTEYGAFLSLASLVAVAASAIAACLGVLQTWSDQRPAARALLLHRGITADAAFCGKLLAGLLLYAVAVFVPLFGMAAFIMAVGIEHRAASPSALVPAALVGVISFSCWPAAMLVVQRDARIIGSRLLPAITAGLTVLACAALLNAAFWMAITIAALALVGFFAAARSVFVNSGQVATGGGRAATVVFVTLALLMVNLLFMVVVEYFQMSSAAVARGNVYHSYPVEFGPDGKPWLTRSVYSNVTYAYEADQVAPMATDRSVRGELQPVPKDWKTPQKWTPYMTSDYAIVFGRRFTYVTALQIPSGSSFVNRSWVLDTDRDVILVYRTGQDSRFHLETTLSPPAEVGSYGELATIGNDSTAANSTLVTSTGVFSLPGHGTTVDLMYAWPTPSKLKGAHIASQRDQKASFGVFARLEDRAVVLAADTAASASPAAKSLGSFPGAGEVFATEVRLPDKLAEAQVLTLAKDPANDNSFVATAQNYTKDWSRLGWMRFDADGNIKEQADFDNSTDDNAVEVGHGVAAFIPPGGFLLGVAVMGLEPNQGVSLESIWEEAADDPMDTATFIGFCGLQPLIGIPLALWAARRRRLRKRETGWWVAWAFLFGPLGSLAILAVYPRISCEPCPFCRKPTRVDIANCEKCSQSLEDIPKLGIEIFDGDRPVSHETVAVN